jgi:hypothetical protein
MWGRFAFLLAAALAALAAAGCRHTAAPPPPPPAPAGTDGPPVRPLGDGRWQVGDVTLDRAARTVTIPAVVNQDRAAVEYLLVASSGKTHESVLRTDAAPLHVHAAMLLLGARAATDADPAWARGRAAEPPGDVVTLEIAWRDARGRARRRPAERWVWNEETRAAMSRGPWRYNGSQLFRGLFMAQEDGSVIALISDPDALVNNPRRGRENDEIWRVNTRRVPPVGTPVEVVVRLAGP